MKLREAREEKGLSRKELAELTGISFRTLQDYEQGHKRLLSAGAETLFKLSVALICTPETFLLDELEGGDWIPGNKIPPEIINGWVYHVDQYQVNGRWITDGIKVAITFLFHGQLYLLPIEAVINEHTKPWMRVLAVMLTEMKIEEILFNEKCAGKGRRADE